MSFQPINTQNSQGANFGQLNDMVRQLNKEQITKVFKFDSNNAVFIGKLPYDGGIGLMVQSPDGSSVGIGSIPGSTTEYGFFCTDKDGNLIMKIVSGTSYIYRTDKTNVMQSGVLPDKTVGWAVAADGYQVPDGYS